MRIEGVSSTAYTQNLSQAGGTRPSIDETVQKASEGKDNNAAVIVSLSVMKKANDMGQVMVDKLLNTLPKVGK